MTGVWLDEHCDCGGCLGAGPCDDGTPCSHGCGGSASTPWGTCQSCEDELTGRDVDRDIEEAA